jgi:hypothetical protein
MSPDTGTVNAPTREVSDEIAVRRVPESAESIVAAARVWALAFEARRREVSMPSAEGAELALYDALSDVSELTRAELALYEAVLTADLIAK